LAIPFFVVGKIVANSFDPALKDYISRYAVVSMNVLITALWCVLIYKLGVLFEFSSKVSVVLSLIFGLATIAWPYSKYFFSEPALGFFISLSLYCLFKFANSRKAKALFFSGLSLGIAITVKLAIAAIIPSYLVYLVLKFKNLSLKSMVRNLSIFIFSICSCLGLIAAYNFARFGNILETGYPNLFEPKIIPTGLYGLLFSPGRSIFVFQPVIIFTIFVIKEFYRKHKPETMLLASIFLIYLFILSSWQGWDGGLCWGSRYLLPFIPFWILPLGIVVQKILRQGAKLLKAGFLGLFLLSALFQLPAVLLRYDIYINEMGSTSVTNFNPRYFPIVGQTQKLAGVNFVPFQKATISGLDIHDQSFKNEFSRTLDLWFVYLLKFGSQKMLVYFAFVPLLSLMISAYLLIHSFLKRMTE
jgi:hypothetical protein